MVFKHAKNSLAGAKDSGPEDFCGFEDEGLVGTAAVDTDPAPETDATREGLASGDDDEIPGGGALASPTDSSPNICSLGGERGGGGLLAAGRRYASGGGEASVLELTA
jgi:hypothetical protein